MKPPLLICICGPTAVGKTQIALDLASRFQTEIISADSRQIYREMQIGTAPPSPEELRTVPHHFIGELGIHESFTAGDFEREALIRLSSIFSKHQTAIVCGGTGLFLKALLEGLDIDAPQNPELRSELIQFYRDQGLEALQRRYDNLKESPIQVDRSNPRRLMRAIEIAESASGNIKSKVQERPFRVQGFVLERPRHELYERIERRIDQMLAGGLEDEARNLYPYRHLNPLQTVGYTEWFGHFDGLYEHGRALELIKRNSRRYAKRQMTWFRNQTDFTWISPPFAEKIYELIRD